MKRYAYIILMIVIPASFNLVSGQSEPVYSQYMFDKIIINPAYAGSSNWLVGSLKHRSHTRGIEGAPETSLFTFHAPLQKKSMGVGLKACYDRTAISNTLSLSGVYSFHIGFGNGKLSFGLEGGMVNKLADFSGLIRTDHDDVAIPENAVTELVPDASFGIYFSSQNYYFGGSVDHLLSSSIIPSDQEHRIINLDRSYSLIGGYISDVEDILTIEYGLMARYQPRVPILTDFYVNLNFLERFTIGGALRSLDMVSAMLKINVTKNIHVAYSYDFNLNALSNFSSGSHEIMLSYGIKLLPPPSRREIHPRYYF